jgi:nucleoid-associated protein YgaU
LLILREGGGEPEEAKEGTFLWLYGGMGTGIASLKKNGRPGNIFRGRQQTTRLPFVQSGSSSTAPSPVPAMSVGRTYTVVKGDNRSKIATSVYGNANKWRTIYEANKDVIKDPNLIHSG